MTGGVIIKGINKHIYVVDIKSDVFEKAVFVLKPSYLKKSISDNDLAREANQIIESKIKSYVKKKKSSIF